MASSKKTPIDKLDVALNKILAEYQDSIEENVETITKEMGQKGATALRQQTKKTFEEHTGEYAKGWKYDFRKTRRYAKTTIYNDHYSLPHLLEHDHVIRNGTQRVYGTVKGREHIKPIADKLVSKYQEEVVSKL